MLDIYSKSNEVLNTVLNHVGLGIEERENRVPLDESKIQYNVITMKDGSMQRAVADEHNRLYTHRLKGRTTNESNSLIQQRMEDSGRVQHRLPA